MDLKLIQQSICMLNWKPLLLEVSTYKHINESIFQIEGSVMIQHASIHIKTGIKAAPFADIDIEKR